MPSHDHMRQDELEPAAPKRPTPEPVQRGPLELAGQIGNSNMQRVAGSPALQRSPAAAGLIHRSPLARESEDDGAAAATPDAEVEAPAATPDSGVEKEDEDAPETTAESAVEKQPEVPPPPLSPHGLGKESEGASEPAGGVSKEAGSGEKEPEATPVGGEAEEDVA